MQYTDNEAALIGGLISNYFLRPAVSAALKDSYIHVLEHLHTGRVSAADHICVPDCRRKISSGGFYMQKEWGVLV